MTSLNSVSRDSDRKKNNSPRLENINLVPLSERDAKTITVIMYSENVRPNDIETWLRLRCQVVRGMELRDQDGVKTGAHRFFVKLRRDQPHGELTHLPSTIQLGRERGNVFYQGQPKTCRKCGSRDHLAADCNAAYCKNCKTSSHTTRNCNQPMKCNLCGSEAHTFRSCPKSYANRTRTPDPDPWADPEDEENAAADLQQGDATSGEQQTEPVLDDQGGPPTNSARPTRPAAEEAPEQPGESDLPTERAVMDWSDPPDLEDDTGNTTDDEDGSSDSAVDEDDTSHETQLDLPERLANSTAISSSFCRDMLEKCFTERPVTVQGAVQQHPGSVKRQKQDSTEESIILDTQVWPAASTTSVSFLDAQNLDAFSNATKMKVAGEGDEGFQKKAKKKRKKEKPLPPLSFDPRMFETPLHV